MLKRLAATALLIGAASLAPASAQVKSGAFGVSGGFASGSTLASVLFTASSNFQIDLGVGYSTTSFSTTQAGTTADESLSQLAFMLGGRLFFSGQNVYPYIGLSVGYATLPKTTVNSFEMEQSTVSIMPAFGAQGMLTSNIALWAQLGVGVNLQTQKMSSPGGSLSFDNTSTTITLGGSAVGASFYF